MAAKSALTMNPEYPFRSLRWNARPVANPSHWICRARSLARRRKTGRSRMTKAIEALLMTHGWNHNAAQDIWTDPSKRTRGWIKVVATGWYHLDAEIKKERDLETISHGHSAEDFAEYLKGL